MAEFKPKLLIVGASAYPRDYDYAAFKKIADDNGALLMCDMAHTSGLIATQNLNDPFPYCDVVTSTTHKSLRGPRSGIIFMRKKYEDAVNFAVFPTLSGGPHNTQIAALATQMKQVMTDKFRTYSTNVIQNAQALAAELMARGEKLISGGTDNHIVLWDVRQHDLTGSKV